MRDFYAGKSLPPSELIAYSFGRAFGRFPWEVAEADDEEVMRYWVIHQARMEHYQQKLLKSIEKGKGDPFVLIGALLEAMVLDRISI